MRHKKWLPGTSRQGLAGRGGGGGGEGAAEKQLVEDKIDRMIDEDR
jgi:hypothetical protein